MEEIDVLKELDALIDEAKENYRKAAPGSQEQERQHRMLIEFFRTREDVKKEMKRAMDKDHEDYIASEREEERRAREDEDTKRRKKEEKTDRALKWITGIVTALGTAAACFGGLYLTARGQKLDYNFGNSTSNTNKILSRNAVPKW